MLLIVSGVFALLVFMLVPEWDGEQRLVIALGFALVAVVIAKTPVVVLARWLA